VLIDKGPFWEIRSPCKFVVHFWETLAYWYSDVLLDVYFLKQSNMIQHGRSILEAHPQKKLLGIFIHCIHPDCVGCNKKFPANSPPLVGPASLSHATVQLPPVDEPPDAGGIHGFNKRHDRSF